MMSAWTLTIDDGGIAWLVFDRPGEKVNTFTSATMAELEERLEEVAAATDVRALVIRSGKPDSFIVGADIDELAALADEEAAREKAREGQRIFAKLAALRVPTVAAVHGACMGGGLEMALACDYRVATDHPKTSLALPEVNLGILPGWGGTQRLPRVVGLMAALDMILAGKAASARKALRIGLTDATVAEAFLEEQVRSFVDRVSAPGGRERVRKARRRKRGMPARLMEATPLGRAFMLHMAKRTVLRKTKGQYPAPLEALRVLRRTNGWLRHVDYEREARALGRLAVTPISRNLVRLFQGSQRLKKGGGDDRAAAIDTGVVVGAGAMGGGIAWALANAGIGVRLKDISWDAVARGTAAAAEMFRQMVKRRKMTEGEMNLAMHRISGTLDHAGFERAGVVIEAVVEDLAIKRRVLREVEAQVPGDCIICTNTSSLSIDDMAGALKRPERFVGLHFFNPVNRMQLVEVVPGARTSQATVATAVGLVRRMGKLPVVVGPCAGFLVNRILLPYIVECTSMFEEGVGVERIDRALERFGMPMGPLTLADEVGLDVGYKVAKVLEEAYGERMHVPEGFGRVVASGELSGRKSGRGFYVWDGKKRKPNPEAARLALNGHANGAAPAMTDDDVVDRAVLVMVNEAARCLEEGVASDPESLDIAMVMGTGFAPFRGGVLRYADERGAGAIVKRLNELADRWGDRFRPAPLLERVAGNGGSFYTHAAEAKEKQA